MLIDPFRFARTAEELETVITLLPEGRLQGIISENSDVSLLLKGSRNENRRYVLEGHISGSVTVQCQVCLDNIKVPLDINFRLFPVMSEQQAERLKQDLEPIVIEDNSLALSTLVTNELILSMSVTNSHLEVDGSDCISKDSYSSGILQEVSQEEKKVSPFAILKSFKQKDS